VQSRSTQEVPKTTQPLGPPTRHTGPAWHPGLVSLPVAVLLRARTLSVAEAVARTVLATGERALSLP
jgi:hypothetical protein